MHTQRIILLVMMFLLPLWLTFGRALFGSFGWLIFPYLFIVAPILFIDLLIILLLGLKTPWRPIDTALYTALYINVLIHGFFITDFGDAEDSIVSVFSRIAGPDVIEISGILALITFFTSAILLVVVLIRAIVLRIQVMKRRTRTAQN